MSNRSEKRTNRLIFVLLILITLAVYWQVWDFEFTNYDDDVYVENNPVVLSGITPTGVRWAFTANYQATWQPMVWLSLMLDAEIAKWTEWLGGIELGRKNAGIFHLTNVILHLANTLLLFVVLSRMTGYRWRSAFVAALFAVHPLHVESVAWVAERKDVLSTLFWMLAILAYTEYIRSPSTKSYTLIVGAFVIGLMSKPMLVTLPLALLLLDWWPMGRHLKHALSHASAIGKKEDVLPSVRSSKTSLLMEKLPLLVIAAVGCVIALWAQRGGGAVASLESYPMGIRLANAAVSYMTYLNKTIIPKSLAIPYPHPGDSLPVWLVILSGFMLFVITAGALLAARSRLYITMGWLWYIVTLVPVIGIVQFGKHAMADRFTYIPLIGIFIIIAWGVPDVLRRMFRTSEDDRRLNIVLSVIGVLTVTALMVPAYIQVGYWRNSITLFSHAIKVTKGNSLAHNNLGNALLARGDAELAVNHFREALKYHPEYTDADYNLGNALYEIGDVEGAIRQYRKVIKAAPQHTRARNNLGSILAQQGKLDEAIEQFEAVLRIDPNNPSARQNLENARLAKSGEL